MADFFDRLDKYMEYSGLNDNKLTVLAQLSVGALGKQRKGGRGLSVESIARILRTCPDLNAEWLMTGNGDMLKKVWRGDKIIPDMTMEQVLSRDEKLIRDNERLLVRIEELEKKLGLNNTPPHVIDAQLADI